MIANEFAILSQVIPDLITIRNEFDYLTISNIAKVNTEILKQQNKPESQKEVFNDGKSRDDWDSALQQHLTTTELPNYEQIFKSASYQ